MKKVISVFLSLVMLVGCLSVMGAGVVNAADYVAYPTVYINGGRGSLYKTDGTKIAPVEPPEGFLADAVKDCIGDLAKAAKTLKNTNFNVSEGGEADADKIEENTKAAVGAVQDFAKKYNETVSFLKDNKDVSNRVSALSNSFNDAGYFASSLSKVGVTVKSTGELSVDTERLTKALKDDPKSVENILGKDGFAGRTEKKAENAQRQSDKMFPSVSSMMGSSVSDAKRMYSANTVNRSMGYESVGSLLNMYF